MNNLELIVSELKDQRAWLDGFGPRIQAIEHGVSGMRDDHAELVKSVNKLADNHQYILHGNGKPGVLLRLDRLEQSEGRRVWQFRVFWGALIGAIVTGAGGLVVALIRGGP